MLAHRPTRADRFKPGRWAHPSRSKQLHAMNNHTERNPWRTPSTASGRAMGTPSPRLVCLTP